MTQELIQYKDSNPTLSPVTPSNTAESSKAFGEVFGEVAKTAAAEAGALTKEQHDVEQLTAENSIYQLSTKTKSEIYQNPGMANETYARYDKVAQGLLQGLSGVSRAKAQKAYQEHMGSAQVLAARITGSQNKIQLKSQFQELLPAKLQAFNDSFGVENLDRNGRDYFDFVDQAHKSNVIDTPTRDKAIAQGNMILKRHETLHEMANAGGVDAKTWNAITAPSFVNDDTNNINNPIDETTSQLYDAYDQDKTFQSAMSDAKVARYPNLDTLHGLKPDQFQHVSEAYIGANKAKGVVNAASSFHLIQTNLQALKDKPSLTPREEGEKAFYENHLNNMVHNYVATMEQTPQGRRIALDQKQGLALINSTVYATPEEKNKAIIGNTNRYINLMLSLTQATDTPANVANVIPNDMTRQASSAFEPNGTTHSATVAIESLDKPLRYWLAKTMKEDNQKAAVYSASLILNRQPPGSTSDQFAHDMLYAQRTNRDDTLIKDEDSSIHKKISASIASELNNELEFTNRVPEGETRNGISWSTGLVKSGENYVKDQMLKNNDFKGTNYRSYVNDFVSNVKKGYNLKRGLNYAFNATEIDITNSQADKVAYYELVKAKDDIIARTGSAQKADRDLDLNRLMVTNTRDGNIVVMDQHGTIIRTEAYSKDTIELAEHDYRKNQLEIETARANQNQPQGQYTRMRGY